ncbi:MAG TPA: ATP-binding protein [Gemmataceae bacterium]|jgi:PAS domain S-box-containing protein|nr:ATP-binding protein [Gemmataceae bacterium]
MRLSLRRRILLTLAPLLLLLAAVGGAGVWLLHRLGGQADLILRENYDSVRAMFRLNEALERLDSSFMFALSGREDEARRQYRDSWPAYEEQLRVEQNNITLPGEAELVDRLTRLTRRYRELGDRFFERPAGAGERGGEYYGTADAPGLLGTFRELKAVSGNILRINQEHMEESGRIAGATAHRSLIGFGIGLGAAAVLAALLTWRLVRAVIDPIRQVTHAAEAIGAGQLHMTVPVHARDELGKLAQTFNAMTERLREYRQVNMSRLLRAQQTGQATIDSFPDPVLVVDPEGRVELANPAARRVLGVEPAASEEARWQPPEPLRRPLTEAIEKQRPFLTESFEQAMTFHHDGADRAFLPQVRPIQDRYGGTLGAAIVLDDVTKFRLLDRLKTDLVATVSHELKTPLTSIRLAVHVLLEEAVGPLEPKQVELLVDARENAERLLRMIESLLALARLEDAARRLELRPEQPEKLLRAAAEDIAARAVDKRVEVKVEAAAGLPQVGVDRDRFDHALANLLDNALIYTRPGGRVTLSAAAAEVGGVRLSVADTGVGIPPDALPHVFDKFFRGPDGGRSAGTGLGLAIVREIVLAHGGTITCESAPGQGTTFHITLPAWGAEP